MLFSDALLEYATYLKGVDKADKTIKGYFQDLNFFEKWLLEEYNCPTYLEDITIDDIEKFLRMLKEERDYKPSSRKRLSASIKMFYRYCFKKKLCRVDIAGQIEPIHVPQVEREFLTEEEVIDFVKAVDHKLAKVAILTMFYAGLRVSECLDLKVKDVDMEKKILRVIAGKGNKNRTIPICDKLLVIFKDYNTWREDSEYFLTTKASGGFSRTRLTAIIRDTRRELKLEKKVTPHMFRHSFASRLVLKDVNIVNISKLLGHSDVKVTSIYMHTDMTQLEEAVNLM